MNEINLSELARRLGGALTCPGDVTLRGVAPLESAGPEELAFLANEKYVKHMAANTAAAVIVARDYDGPGERLLRCEDAYFAFREAMVAIYGFREHPFEGIAASAHVDPSARIGEDVRISTGAHVAAGAIVGDRTTIYPNVFVGTNCRIGCACVLHPSVTLYDGTVLGDRVTVHANTSVGQDGFGYATHAGTHEKIPQVGWVEIGDDCEIGAGCAIDRATMGPTVIGAGTKFSNLVTIGHGTRMGRHCLVVAQAGIAGSTRIGDHCVFAGQCGVAGHISIGDAAKIGAQAGVTNSVEGGRQYWGTPARPLPEAKRSLVALQHLPEMRSTLRRLAAEVAVLRRRLGEEEGNEQA